MSGKKSLVRSYERMSLDDLREATKQFDEEMAVDRSRPLTPAERKAWEKARRKPGRARGGRGRRSSP